jgi:hypothetical protein
MNKLLPALALAFTFGAALAKIPAPVLDDAAKAKAAEAAAKTAWQGKVDAWQLCKAQGREGHEGRHAAGWRGQRHAGCGGRAPGRLRGPGAVCLHAAGAEAAGSRGCAFACRQRDQPAEHQYAIGRYGPGQEVLSAASKT